MPKNKPSSPEVNNEELKKRERISSTLNSGKIEVIDKTAEDHFDAARFTEHLIALDRNSQINIYFVGSEEPLTLKDLPNDMKMSLVIELIPHFRQMEACFAENPSMDVIMGQLESMDIQIDMDGNINEISTCFKPEHFEVPTVKSNPYDSNN